MSPSEKNIAGDNLCRFTDAEITDMIADQTKIPPEAEFLESCRRFHARLSSTVGELGLECMTIAQLERRVMELEDAITEAGIILAGSCEQWGGTYRDATERAMKRLSEVMNHPEVLKRQGI